MQNAESILVIIVSTVLALFLLTAIIVMIMIARLLRATRRMVEHAERVLQTAGEAAAMMKNASGPLAVFKLFRNAIRTAERKHN